MIVIGRYFLSSNALFYATDVTLVSQLYFFFPSRVSRLTLQILSILSKTGGQQETRMNMYGQNNSQVCVFSRAGH